MNKRPGEKLGMSIKGGMKNFPGDESNDAGIFISRVSHTHVYMLFFCLMFFVYVQDIKKIEIIISKLLLKSFMFLQVCIEHYRFILI